ncbi:hypothetical protein LZ30DRAFT_387407 [Colletotrichum cereale]|nr:hypothetical protein LZ30DRAFT_387407 [Colletotrichum cereale]
MHAREAGFPLSRMQRGLLAQLGRLDGPARGAIWNRQNKSTNSDTVPALPMCLASAGSDAQLLCPGYSADTDAKLVPVFRSLRIYPPPPTSLIFRQTAYHCNPAISLIVRSTYPYMTQIQPESHQWCPACATEQNAGFIEAWNGRFKCLNCNKLLQPWPNRTMIGFFFTHAAISSAARLAPQSTASAPLQKATLSPACVPLLVRISPVRLHAL